LPFGNNNVLLNLIECSIYVLSSSLSLTRRIAESRLWPVEVMRSPQVGATKGGKAGKDKAVRHWISSIQDLIKSLLAIIVNILTIVSLNCLFCVCVCVSVQQGEDETQLSFHGVAYVDMAPLLYPGARRVRGAYRLYPFYDSDLLVKVKVASITAIQGFFRIWCCWGLQSGSGLRHSISVLRHHYSLGFDLITGRDRESNRAAQSWPSVVRVRGGFGPGALLETRS
jgi:hypothetical protein